MCVSAKWELERRAKPSSLDGCPMFTPAYMGRERIFQMLSLHCTRIFPLGRKALEGAGPPLFWPMYPDFLHGAPPTPACAAFFKESRIKFANAIKIHRKSGVRWGEHRGAPVQSQRASLGDLVRQSSSVNNPLRPRN